MFRVRVAKCYGRRRPKSFKLSTLREDSPVKPNKTELDRAYSQNLASAINWTGNRRNHNNDTYVTSNQRFA